MTEVKSYISIDGVRAYGICLNTEKNAEFACDFISYKTGNEFIYGVIDGNDGVKFWIYSKDDLIDYYASIRVKRGGYLLIAEDGLMTDYGYSFKKNWKQCANINDIHASTSEGFFKRMANKVRGRLCSM